MGQDRRRRSLLIAALVSLLLAPASVASETVDRHGIEGEPIALDAKDPDVADYLQSLKRLIHRNWAYPCVRDAVTAACEYKSANLIVEFGIFRDGPIAFIDVRLSSGLSIYDDAAVKAIKLASPFPPVPSALMDTRKAGSPGVPIVARFFYVEETDLRSPLRESSAQKPSDTSTAKEGSVAASKAGVVTAVEGNVTARRETLSDRRMPLKVGDSIFLQDTIMTGSLSEVDMLLWGKVEVSLRERADLNINKVPGRSGLYLLTGPQMSLNLPEDSEEIAVITPNAVAYMRGGRFSVGVLGNPAGGGVITHVDVLAGETEVTNASGGSGIQVYANEGVTITGGAVGPIRPLRTR